MLACGDDLDTPPVDSKPTDISLLQSKYDLYLSLQTDSMRNDCDGLLFRSLTAVGGNTHINIMDHFRDGKWNRSPDNVCTTTSTISRDMMMGLIWWMYTTKNLTEAIALRNYAQEHYLKMGEGDSRVLMSPALYSTLLMVIERLEGKLVTSNLPMVWDKTLVGYKAHLTILHILLRAELSGYVDDIELDVIMTYANREPKNALFTFAYAKYVDGNYERSIKTLMDESLFPKDRLPACRDREDKWIFEREYSTIKDWIPGDCSNIHSGGEFLFVTSLILLEVR
jgi:hypothetical protein